MTDRKRTIARKDYNRYIKSPEWREVRQRFIESKVPKICFGCDKPWGTGDHLHHRSYARLGCEKIGDLVPLCAACHAYVHVHITVWSGIWSQTHKGIRARRQELGLPPRPMP